MTQRAWPAWARASEIVDLLRLSGPIAISRMAWMLMGLTDAIVLGQVVGQEHELAFVLNSWLPLGIAIGLSMGLLLGVQVLTSEMIGRGEKADTGRIFRRGMVWGLGLGVALTLIVYLTAAPLFHWIFVEVNPNAGTEAQIPRDVFAAETASVTQILSLSLLGFTLSAVCSYYLEALRKPLLVTVTSYIGVGLNLVIDLALVLGWWGFEPMGAEGVAWATVGSRWAITIALLIAVIWLTPALSPSKESDPGEGRRQLAVGGGTAVANVAEWGGFNLTYVIAAFISVAANTIYGFTVQVMGFCFMFFIGIATATSVRVAEHIGAGQKARAKDASRLGVAATFVLGGVLALLLVLFSDAIALGLVNERAQIDGIVLSSAISALLVFAAIAVTFDGLQVTASMALRAQGVVWAPSLIHVLTFFVLMIPLCYVFGLVLERGSRGMMEAVTLSLLTAGLMQWALLEYKTARHKV